MKTTPSQTAFLTVAALLSTVCALAAIDIKVPDVPDSLKDLQTKVDKAASNANSPAAKARISASPRNVSLSPGQNQGSTTVKWNSGAHPTAQLRVQVDGAPDVAVLGVAGTGSRIVAVKRGSTYLYMLTEGGQRLAVVTVTASEAPVAEPKIQDPKQAPSESTEAKSLQKPTIRANPQVVTVPGGQGTGTTSLSWDGGPDHQYAEVWVGVDGDDPTFMVEQGKGSRRVTVEPGKTYRYILTDSNQELSTVTVRGK